METEIYYFSGTGNSLHTARELQRRLPGSKLTALVSSLQKGSFRTDALIAGFVFPNFCLTIPIPLQEFLRQADLSSAAYIFGVCTRGGSMSLAFDYIDDLLCKQGKSLNARLELNMPWNHPMQENLPALNSEEKMQQQEAELQTKLDDFSRHIIEGEDYLQQDSGAEYEMPAGMKLFDLLVSRNFNYTSHRFMYQKLVHFYADDSCSGCGTCEKVCLSSKITLVDGKPQWQQEVGCSACFACINYCPKRAIQIESNFFVRSRSESNDRYHHPAITAVDIAAQKECNFST